MGGRNAGLHTGFAHAAILTRTGSRSRQARQRLVGSLATMSVLAGKSRCERARARETWQTFSRSAHDDAVTERAAFNDYVPNLFTSGQIDISDFWLLEGKWIALMFEGANGMKSTMLVRKLWKDERGQDLTEYALLVPLLALSAIASLSGLSSAISETFSSAAVHLSATT
jgi:Flp pilus assembly pilin Flp